MATSWERHSISAVHNRLEKDPGERERSSCLTLRHIIVTLHVPAAGPIMSALTQPFICSLASALRFTAAVNSSRHGSAGYTSLAVNGDGSGNLTYHDPATAGAGAATFTMRFHLVHGDSDDVIAPVLPSYTGLSNADL
eukprot:SAG25_NODE_1663_length_2584_cov_1.911469_2_plen_138_part_00